MTGKSFWRNPAVRRELLIVAGLLLLCALLSRQALAGALGVAAVHFLFSWQRYRRIALMNEEIDAILHEQEAMLVSSYQEGELAILESQIYKITMLLRQQADEFKKEKQYLADSLADISHQLRTPLTALHLVASMLQKQDLEPLRRRELVQEMCRLLSRMDWQIHTLLRISKLDAESVVLQQEVIALQDLVAKAREPLAIPMELRQQRIEVEIAPGCFFRGDMQWSAEAISNIFKNCMESMPLGGRILVTGRQNALFTELVIEDEGSGIAPEDLPHLFERFYKGKNASNESIGIGLALTRMILLREKASIKAENRCEKGARFIIRFYHATE